MAVLYACQIKYGAAAERISVKLEAAEPEFVILGRILKLVRRSLKGVDTAVFSPHRPPEEHVPPELP